MWTRSPVQGIFGRSPFKPIQEHMKVVDACASEAPALLEALAAGDKRRLLEIKERIFDLEHEADKVKNEMGAALLEQAILVPSNARWTSLTMGAAKAFWGWVVGWGRTI